MNDKGKSKNRLEAKVQSYIDGYSYEKLIELLGTIYEDATIHGCTQKQFLHALEKSEPYGRKCFGTTRANTECDYKFLGEMCTYLKKVKKLYRSSLIDLVADRIAGRTFNFNEHLRGLLYSQLSAQTEWVRIVPHLPEIDDLFWGYDAEKIFEHSAQHYIEGIMNLKCGSRCTARQMTKLHENISIMKSIEAKFGSMDTYVTSADPRSIVNDLSHGEHKLFMVGPALAWEYLRNVGIDGAKPDVHVCRFFGSDRLGFVNRPVATTDEAIEIIMDMSLRTNLTMVEIDNIIWSFCASSFGEICGATPKCNQCVIRDHCRKRN